MKAFPKQAYSQVNNGIPMVDGRNFPSGGVGIGHSPTNTVTIYADQPGMDLRDYFAAQAMQAFLSGKYAMCLNDLVVKAYATADAMMKAREQ